MIFVNVLLIAVMLKRIKTLLSPHELSPGNHNAFTIFLLKHLKSSFRHAIRMNKFFPCRNILL